MPCQVQGECIRDAENKTLKQKILFKTLIKNLKIAIMKKNRLFFMFAALFVAAAVMFSCQKEEVVNLEEGVMLKAAYTPTACETNCIDNTTTDFWYQTGSVAGTIGAGGGAAVKTISYSVHNTKDAVLVVLTYTRNNGSNNPTVAVTVGGTTKTEQLTQGTAKTFTFPTTITTTPCVPVLWSFIETIKDGPSSLTANDTYKLIPLCPTVCENELTTTLTECEGVKTLVVTFTAVEAGPVVIQGGLTAGTNITSSSSNILTLDADHSSADGPSNVTRWEGSVEACQLVTITITFTGGEGVDDWTAERDDDLLDETLPIEAPTTYCPPAE
jgi:hypothetical protein